MPDETIDAELKAAVAQGPEALFNYIWATKYVPMLDAELALEQSRRADAFAENVTFTVCGEEIHMMTPRFLVDLDGMDNPFVAWTKEAEYEDIEHFIWHLHRDNNPNAALTTAYRRGKFKNRLNVWVYKQGMDAAVSEVFRFLDRVFIDLPNGGEHTPTEKKDATKPPTVHSIAPLLVGVAAAIGPFDPLSGKLLGQTPIPRLIQYQRAAMRQTHGKEAHGHFDSMRSKCMEEMNEIMAQSRKG